MAILALLRLSQLQLNSTLAPTRSFYFSYSLETECMCGMCRESPEYCVVTGTRHVTSKQPIIGGHYYVMVSSLIDCHLLYHSNPWRISTLPSIERANIKLRQPYLLTMKLFSVQAVNMFDLCIIMLMAALQLLRHSTILPSLTVLYFLRSPPSQSITH